MWVHTDELEKKYADFASSVQEAFENKLSDTEEKLNKQLSDLLSQFAERASLEAVQSELALLSEQQAHKEDVVTLRKEISEIKKLQKKPHTKMLILKWIVIIFGLFAMFMLGMQLQPWLQLNL